MEDGRLLIPPFSFSYCQGSFMSTTSEHVFLSVTSDNNDWGCVVCQHRDMSEMNKEWGSTSDARRVSPCRQTLMLHPIKHATPSKIMTEGDESLATDDAIAGKLRGWVWSSCTDGRLMRLLWGLCSNKRSREETVRARVHVDSKWRPMTERFSTIRSH